ncbi:MAG: tetratricopeptide repeat protein [Saprospiraceae bacterium]|nr:tetratricopeptide repeat protein [Saprospiraceae bacterium]
MRTILLTLLSACFSLSLVSQTNSNPVVLHSSGQVQYFATAGAAPKKVYPGLQLQVSGKIRCLKGGSAKLLYQGKAYIVSGARTQDISEVVKANVKATQIGFTGRFFNFITESLQESESTEKLQKHHRRYMGKNSASIKGFSSKQFEIVTPLVLTGKLPAAKVTFKWRNTTGSGPYTFQLCDESGNIVASLLAKDTLVTLDLEELAMNFEAEYTWQVTRNDGKSSSAPMPFELTRQTQEKAQKDLEIVSSCDDCSDSEKRLMLAYFLEQENQFYQAADIYNAMLEKDPNSTLTRRLFAAFMARMNQLSEGEKLINSIPEEK